MKAGKGGHAALRGFKFQDGSTAEFVYPKAEAVSLAKANGTTIPAIDPASEGRPDASKLSHTDMEMVTLWMLTPTRVGADNQPGIQAARYQAPAASSAASSSVASVSTPPPPPAATQPRPAPAPAATGNDAAMSKPASSTQVARATPPPVHVHAMTALPHTASSLPLIELTGILSLLGAAMLAVRRTTAA